MKLGRTYYVPAEYDVIVYFRPIGNSKSSPFRIAAIRKRFGVSYFALKGTYVKSVTSDKFSKTIERVTLPANYQAPILPS